MALTDFLQSSVPISQFKKGQQRYLIDFTLRKS